VFEAGNGKEGPELFKRASADRVIRNIVLPKKEGFEVLMKLREKQITPVKIIAISGGGQKSTADNPRPLSSWAQQKCSQNRFPTKCYWDGGAPAQTAVV